MMANRVLVMLSCLMFSITAYPQSADTLKAGKIMPYAGQLRTAAYSYVIYSTGKDGKLLWSFIMKRNLQLVTLDQKTVWLAVQEYHGSEAVDVDSTWFEPEGLLPVVYSTMIASEGLKEKVRFENGKIRADILKQDSAFTVDQSTTTCL